MVHYLGCFSLGLICLICVSNQPLSHLNYKLKAQRRLDGFGFSLSLINLQFIVGAFLVPRL